MKTTSNAPAGTLDANFEFFEKDGEVFYLNNGSTHPFSDLPTRYYDILYADLMEHPKAYMAMDLQGFESGIAKLKQWAICNFGDFDLKADLTEEGVIIREHVHCSQRGACKFEGIICPPLMVLNGTLTNREVQIIKLVARDLLDKQIADMLGISVATMAVHRTHIEQKIGCHSKAGITAFAYQNNIL